MKASEVAKADEKSEKSDEEVCETPSEFPSSSSEKVFVT